MEAKENKSQSVGARVVSEILNSFNGDSPEIGIAELARKLGMYPSKIHRVVSALERSGLLEKNAVTRKYKIGLRLFEIGNLYPVNLSMRRIARPHALELARAFETNVHLGIMSKSMPCSVVIIDRVINIQSENSFIQRVSFNVPIHSSSLGKALLAFSEDRLVRSILQRINFERFTSSTITDRGRFEKELRLVRNQGYAIDRGETHSDLYCIGAPIRDSSGVIAAISVSDFREKIQKKEVEIINKIISTADSLSYQLGS